MIRELFDLDAEMVILGTLLYDPSAADAAMRMRAEDFYYEENREIFCRMRGEIEAGRLPSPQSIAPLIGDKTIGNLTYGQYLAKLAGHHDRTLLAGCMQTVRELAARRCLASAGEILSAQSRDPDVLPEATAAAGMGFLNEAAASALIVPSAPVDASVALEKLIDSFDGTEADHIIPSGFKSVDKMIGGLPRGEMTIVAGRPSMGKSALMCALAQRIAQKGYGVLMFSLEMPAQSVIARMLSAKAYWTIGDSRNIPYSSMLQKTISPEQRDLLREHHAAFKALTLRIDDQAGLTMLEIRNRARRYAEELSKQGKRLDVVLIDHIGKVKASDRYAGNMVHETGEKSDAIMILAKELNVAAVAAQQLNRGTESRENKRPAMSDLRDTGNLEQDAHTIIFPFRPAYYLERTKGNTPDEEFERVQKLDIVKNKLEAIIAKCRNGETGDVTLFADMASNVIDDEASQMSNHAQITRSTEEPMRGGVYY